jgi:hypothetical protein
MLLAQEEGLLGALLGRDYSDAVHERFLVALKEMMTVEEVSGNLHCLLVHCYLRLENTFDKIRSALFCHKLVGLG